jgi:hypothetical protein
MLHEGKAIHGGLGYGRVFFVEPGSNLFHKNVFGGFLNLDLRIFCADMVAGARTWLSKVEGTEPYESNLKVSFRRHPKGLPPAFSGLPVYS